MRPLQNGWLANFICHGRYFLNISTKNIFNTWEQKNEKL